MGLLKGFTAGILMCYRNLVRQVVVTMVKAE